MRRRIAFLAHGLTLAAAVVCLTAADDVQVIQSPRSTLFIYGYGGSVPSRAIRSEFRDVSRPARRTTGALTDVAMVPAVTVSAPPVQPATKPTPASTVATAPTPKEPANQAMSFGGGLFAPTTAPSPVEPAPDTQIVTLRWNAPPEESVVGYYVYTGDSSRQYTDKVAVGNQTSAQVVVGQTGRYIAVSAYTSEGLESGLSDELVLSVDNPENAAVDGGVQILDSDIR